MTTKYTYLTQDADGNNMRDTDSLADAKIDTPARIRKYDRYNWCIAEWRLINGRYVKLNAKLIPAAAFVTA